MSTIQSKALTDSFRAFATLASPILHIHTSEDYEDALEFVEYLFDLAEDSEKDPLNNLITLISMSIEEYESNQEEPSDLARSPNLQIWQGVQTFRFGRESKHSDLAVSNLITSKSKGLDSKKY